ncbi:MAG: ATP-dependent Clp protease proteolytic subunit [Gammaproteobacteria bacterium]|nr:ATP-dependent Clp protease proteolytic subunit [Gammaproteobacteria bacterium]
MIWTSEVSHLIKDLELRKPPVIIRVNRFDEKAANEFNQKMAAAHSTGQKIIPVVIDSYGGQVYSLMSMIACIRAAELPVATIVEGKAMSCGAVLLSFGDDGLRFADPDATVMIHDVSSGGHGKIEELKADVKEAERLDEKIFTMMARNCGKKDDYFKKKVFNKKHADWFMDAQEAKKHGLVNHLRVPKLTVRVGVDIDFE